MVRRWRGLRSAPPHRAARDGQVALADAVITLMILLVASGIIYTSVSGSIRSASSSRHSENLWDEASTAGSMPLEATVPEVNFTNLSSEREMILRNVTGEELLGVIFELDLLELETGHEYDLAPLVERLEMLYGLALEGKNHVLHAYTTSCGQPIEHLLGQVDGESVARGFAGMDSVDDIPHPRVVDSQEVLEDRMIVTIDLYVWS